MKHTIDANGKTIGRLATQVAALLNGKNSVAFTKNKVTEVSVEVINAAKVKLSGNKMNEKVYKRYSGYPGGLTSEPAKHLAARKGYSELITHAVRGMLPKNKLQDLRMKNLTVNE